MATIKVIYNSSIRRFTIPTSTTWFEFEQKVRSLFSIQISTPITVAYTDGDGDTITISSDLELGEVLSNASGQNFAFTLSTNEDNNKNSWVLEGDYIEPYRIAEAETINVTKEVVKENNVIEEELPTDQNSEEITKESLKKEKEHAKVPTVETQSETFRLHTTVTDETDEPLFEPTIANDKKEETQSRNELLDDPSTSSPSVTVEKGQTGLDSSASTSEARNPKNGPEPVENTDTTDLWEELLKSLLEDTPRRKTLSENHGESSSTNVNPRLVIRVSPSRYLRQTYVPRVAGFGSPRSGSPFARAALLNNARQYTNNCGCAQYPHNTNNCGSAQYSRNTNNCGSAQYSRNTNNFGRISISRQRQPQNNYQFGIHPFYKLILNSISSIIFLSVIFAIAKAAFHVVALLFPIALFFVPILFFVKLHNKLYIRREQLQNRHGLWNHGPFVGSRNPAFSQRSVHFVRPSWEMHNF